jgi:hypothetical protein
MKNVNVDVKLLTNHFRLARKRGFWLCNAKSRIVQFPTKKWRFTVDYSTLYHCFKSTSMKGFDS